jgi:hypothetical protein
MTYHRISFPLEATENRRASSLGLGEGKDDYSSILNTCVQFDADNPIQLKVKLHRKRR